MMRAKWETEKHFNFGYKTDQLRQKADKKQYNDLKKLSHCYNSTHITGP